MNSKKQSKSSRGPFELNSAKFLPEIKDRHIYNNKVCCVTDSKGHAQPEGKNPTELRVDASDGFIPLWAKQVNLYWRFSKSFGSYFRNPIEAKSGIRKLLGEALLGWKDAVPVKFKENNDTWDFEIRMHASDCDSSGCVLASAFFPGPGRNYIHLYPTLFEQNYKEQVETIQHELGHVFGLRHFFANITESSWKSELFGSKSSFTIMNYGSKSILTAKDIRDLKKLYRLVWNGELTEINGTPIRTFSPYHSYR
ncbi:MAG: matrixin family metalloprotease [Saprospiraceae bacterium]|nr:matrixin family metalloprotease [Saprospiraceae bacterium]